MSAKKNNKSVKSDQELLKAIADKDTKAFLEFYDRHASRVYRQLVSGFRDKEAAEDFLQDFWAKVWISPSFLLTNEEGSTTPFLHCYTLRRIADFHRSRVACQEILLSAPVHAEELTPAYSHVLEDMTMNEIMTEISRIVDTLPERDWMIYQLYHHEHQNVKTIAEQLSLSEGTINNKLSSISKRLRKRLKPAYSALHWAAIMATLPGIFP